MDVRLLRLQVNLLGIGESSYSNRRRLGLAIENNWRKDLLQSRSRLRNLINGRALTNGVSRRTLEWSRSHQTQKTQPFRSFCSAPGTPLDMAVQGGSFLTEKQAFSVSNKRIDCRVSHHIPHTDKSLRKGGKIPRPKKLII